MKKKANITDKITEIITNFTDIHANKIDISDNEKIKDKKKFELKRNVKYDILAQSEDSIKLNFSFDIFWEPEFAFNIKINAEMDCTLKEPLEEDLTKEDINYLIENISSNISLICAFLTEKIISKPFIIPPVFEIE